MIDVALEQNGGIGSNNTQIAQQINEYGLGYADTKALCKDLIKSELSKYKDEAHRTAIERDNNLTNSIIQKLSKEQITNETILEEFKNPDLQFAYINAQKAYIRVGTDELENVLSELLFSRIKENRRSLLQLTLNESLNIVPMLLSEQMDILSLCFIIRYTKRNNLLSLETLNDYLNSIILPHVKGEIKKQSLYQHLEYSRCGQVGSSELSLENIFSATYKGLFSKGLPFEKIEELQLKYPACFLRNLHDNDLWQINAIDDKALDIILLSCTVQEDKEKIRNIFNQNIMNGHEIKNKVIELVPEMKNLFDIWNESKLKNLTLTSVGIVIGAIYSKQVSGNEYDLGIWI